jgi:hypothetical protein
MIERWSQMTQIDILCFSSSWLKLVCIPRGVELLSKSSFYGARVETLTFEPDSQLMRFVELRFANCLFGSMCIPRSVQILRRSCFFEPEFSAITFEAESH